MSTFLRSFDIEGINLELELSEEVFQPTLTSKVLAKAVKNPAGSKILDLGCGSGILAIFSARKGAESVTAVDVMPQACALAKSNAKRNGVGSCIDVICSDLYEKIKDQQFEIIISDVSGVADEVARLSPWYPETIPTGGRDGADHIVRLLKESPSHLRPSGSLYFATGTISNVARTLDAAHDSFGENVELVEEVLVPFCTEFNDNFDAMARMKEEGIVDFTVRRSRRLWSLQIYRAWID